jgi:hypothetical protein
MIVKYNSNGLDKNGKDDESSEEENTIQRMKRLPM